MCNLIPRHWEQGYVHCILYICRCAIHSTSGQMDSLWMVVHCVMDRVRKIGSSLQLSAGGRFIFPSHTCTLFICAPSHMHPHTCILTCILKHAPSHMHPHTCILTCILTHASSHMHPHTCTLTQYPHMHPHTCILTHAPSHMHIPHTYHASEIPEELRHAAQGGEVDVDLQDRRTEPYSRPKPKLVAFSGEGHKLGRYGEH